MFKFAKSLQTALRMLSRAARYISNHSQKPEDKRLEVLVVLFALSLYGAMVRFAWDRALTIGEYFLTGNKVSVKSMLEYNIV